MSSSNKVPFLKDFPHFPNMPTFSTLLKNHETICSPQFMKSSSNNHTALRISNNLPHMEKSQFFLWWIWNVLLKFSNSEQIEILPYKVYVVSLGGCLDINGSKASMSTEDEAVLQTWWLSGSQQQTSSLSVCSCHTLLTWMLSLIYVHTNDTWPHPHYTHPSHFLRNMHTRSV